MKTLIALVLLAGSVFAQTPTTIFGTPIVDAPRHVQAGYVGFNGGVGFGIGIAEQLTPGTYVITGMDFLPKGTIRKFSIASMPTGGS